MAVKAPKAGETAIAVNYRELSPILTALDHASMELPEREERPKAGRLYNRLLAMQDKVHKRSPERTTILLKPSEYDTIMDALEFFTASAVDRPWHRKEVGELWLRWLLEGSHAGVEEIAKLRKEFEL